MKTEKIEIKPFFHLLLSSTYTNLILKAGSILFKWKVSDAKDIAHLPCFENDKKTCHILGSGSSLTESIKLINPQSDSVIGLNFSGLAYYNADLYFIEIATKEEKAQAHTISEAQHLLWKHLKEISPETIFIFKNTWEKKNSISAINNLYGKNVTFLRDSVARATTETALQKLIKVILGNFLNFQNQAQTISTVITAIAIAYKAGFNEIVLHGVDLTGPHFYDSLALEDPTLARVINLIKKRENTLTTAPHRTNSAKITHQQALILLKKTLSEKGVTLRPALRDSNLDKAFRLND